MVVSLCTQIGPETRHKKKERKASRQHAPQEIFWNDDFLQNSLVFSLVFIFTRRFACHWNPEGSRSALTFLDLCFYSCFLLLLSSNICETFKTNVGCLTIEFLGLYYQDEQYLLNWNHNFAKAKKNNFFVTPYPRVYHFNVFGFKKLCFSKNMIPKSTKGYEMANFWKFVNV